MTSFVRCIAVSALLLPLLACGEPAYEISRPEVERILNVLASDDMAGRAAFGPEIRQAQTFIAAELSAAGLQPLPGADGFEQPFQVYGWEVGEATVELGGVSLPPDQYAFAAGGPEARWTSGEGGPVIRVGAEDDPSVIIRAMQGGEGAALVLVDRAHEGMFRQVKGFLSRPRFGPEAAEGATVALVLADDPAVPTYDVRVVARAATRELANVAGALPGRTDEVVLFSAHHDHIGIRPSLDGDSIANGANDDASGVTAVIELARFFASRPQPERTLVFVTFTAEEAGGIGSRYFSSQLDPDRIVAMFNIEMIGKPAVSDPNTAWVTGWDRSDFGPILERAVEGTDYRFYADPYPEQNLFYRSDNATLARLGVPAHSISTTPIDVDTDYHQVSDEVSTLDLDHMTQTIRAIARAAATIISGDETPTRVDPAELN